MQFFDGKRIIFLNPLSVESYTVFDKNGTCILIKHDHIHELEDFSLCVIILFIVLNI